MAEGGYRSSVQAQHGVRAAYAESRCGCSRRETTAGRHGPTSVRSAAGCRRRSVRLGSPSARERAASSPARTDPDLSIAGVVGERDAWRRSARALRWCCAGSDLLLRWRALPPADCVDLRRPRLSRSGTSSPPAAARAGSGGRSSAARSARAPPRRRTVLDESWLLDPAHGALRERLGPIRGLGHRPAAGPPSPPPQKRCARQLEQRPVLPPSVEVESATAWPATWWCAGSPAPRVQDCCRRCARASTGSRHCSETIPAARCA